MVAVGAVGLVIRRRRTARSEHGGDLVGDVIGGVERHHDVADRQPGRHLGGSGGSGGVEFRPAAQQERCGTVAGDLDERLALGGQQREEFLVALAGEDDLEEGVRRGGVEGAANRCHPCGMQVVLASQRGLDAAQEPLGQPEHQRCDEATLAAELVVQGLAAGADGVGEVLQPQSPVSLGEQLPGRLVQDLVPPEVPGALDEAGHSAYPGHVGRRCQRTGRDHGPDLGSGRSPVTDRAGAARTTPASTSMPLTSSVWV